MSWVSPSFALAAAIQSAPSAAPPSGAGAESDTRHALVTRIDSPPLIDGRLDDACWQSIQPIGSFTQAEPREGQPPSQATDVRLARDERQLYIGVRCHDTEAARIVATLAGRDAELSPDDRIELLFDTFRDRRNAFFFQISAAGSMGDALITGDGNDFNKPWDGIWTARTSIDAAGWSAEFAIPFTTLNFDPGIPTWGFNIQRVVKRENEFSRWASARANAPMYRPSNLGTIGGLTGLEQGLGLDVTPFFVGRYRDLGEDEDLLGKPGLDALYKITPNVNALLTINTDFADTEVDERQINLTRFPLFFPEKRDFFLQDAGLFKFADLGPETLVPFFSRRIGLDSEGQEVPLAGGLKVTGRQGGWGLGLLDVQSRATADLDAQNLFVGRVTRDLGAQSTAGVLVTAGDPEGTSDNLLVGADLNLRTNTFAGGQNLQSSVYVLQSSTDGETGDHAAYGASLVYPNDVWEWFVAVDQIEEDFDAALGFVPRTGVRDFIGGFTWQPRCEGVVRRYEIGVEPYAVTDLDGNVILALAEIQPFGLEFDSGDEARIEIVPTREGLDEDFEIHDGVVIPADDYEYTRAGVVLETASKREFSGELSFAGGEFFDGERQDFEALVLWRPSSLLTAEAAYEESRIDLPQGEFSTRLASLRANLAFGPDLSWSTLAQWDNESESFGVNSRVRWILRPGEEVRVVWNESWEESASGALAPGDRELAVKLEYTLRF